ncbi:MAG: BadF/BadG/BcrA/BcrD ATPase family protein [Verrucomicrobiota bacterium]|jgi:N-acetylmuramic acid 6-phosphate etherase
MTGDILGIEGGGTKTIALLKTGTRIQRRQFGPLNLKLATDRQILAVLRPFKPTRAAICLAGCRTPADQARVRRLARRVWPKAQVLAGNDLDSGLAAVFGLEQAGIIVISGTGSVVVGRNAHGQTVRAGGWGHWLGDHGSGYWLALTGLRAAVRELDRTGKPSAALCRVLRRLKLKSAEQLIEWITGASKADVARHADIFLRGNRGLALQAASFLAMDCAAVARKLKLETPAVALAGGILQNHRPLRNVVTHRIRQMMSEARVTVWRGETALGALRLAGG